MGKRRTEKSDLYIGLDFDNTVVCYDDVIHRAAVERGLIPPETPPVKKIVRDQLRALGREDDWTKLQGYVYGPGMKGAMAYPGVLDFLDRCKTEGMKVAIISHKTKSPYAGPDYDLHEFALEWLRENGIIGGKVNSLLHGQVFFELTKEDKINRIIEQKCTHFVDDLQEFLEEPGLPSDLIKILFDPGLTCSTANQLTVCSSWQNVAMQFFGTGE